MQHTTPDYRVHLNACLQSDVLAICNVLRTILANEQGSHSVSRPPIFSSGSMQMAQKLLQNVHDNRSSREIVHVLPGSHKMYFKLLFENEHDAGGASYRINFCYRDKRLAACSNYGINTTKSTSKHCRRDDSINAQTMTPEAKRSK